MENCWPLRLHLIYSCKFEFEKLFLGKWHQVRKFEPIIPVGMSFGSQKAVKWSKWNDQSLPSEYYFRNWALRRKITILVYVNVCTPHQKTGWFLKFLQFCLWKTNESMRFNDPRRRNIDWLQCSWENYPPLRDPALIYIYISVQWNMLPEQEMHTFLRSLVNKHKNGILWNNDSVFDWDIQLLSSCKFNWLED